MRLLNVDSLEVEEFFDENIPRYAILSHTWGSEELSFQDWQTICRFNAFNARDDTGSWDFYADFHRNQIASLRRKSGYAKILKSCREARKDKLHFVWVDTCCIDKTSSAELSEAINSMYRWYNASAVCYAYLADVQESRSPSHPDSAFRRSRWFTRGWTLQELLAPAKLLFFDAKWKYISSKSDLAETIHSITGIKPIYLTTYRNYSTISIAQRMSWASRRTTTRKEDMAYCLLGIFEVNMPLLYGEGEKAFLRLQEEIIKESTDQTILAWGYGMRTDTKLNSILAPSPAYFINCGELVPAKISGPIPSFQMTNKGLHIRLRF
ncbi:HET-domain-containing protein, partial [Lepidopterella palustris CBS 459.81]